MPFASVFRVVDEILDPEGDPSKEARYRYTVAHEGGGHGWLHRHLFIQDSAQATLFGGPPPPSVVCRSSQTKERVEWQTDFYASCLLMPRKFVLAAWHEIFPDRKPRLLQPRVPINHPFVEVPRIGWRIGSYDCFDDDDSLLDRITRPLAGRFLVSAIAMRIRLKNLVCCCENCRNSGFLPEHSPFLEEIVKCQLDRLVGAPSAKERGRAACAFSVQYEEIELLIDVGA